MRKLIWITLALVVLLTLLVVGAYAVPVYRPVEAILHQFHLGDCIAPCWAGIRVGETTVDEAFQFLDRAFPADPNRHLARGGGTILLSVYLDRDRMFMASVSAGEEDTVTQVMIMMTNMQDLLLSDVVNVLGPPSCISRYGSTYQSPGAVLAVMGEGGLTSPDAPVNNITILTRAVLPNTYQPNGCR